SNHNKNGSFSGCSSLTKITIKSGITYAHESYYSDDGPLYGCNQISTVIFETGITAIPAYIFEGCNQLSNITIPNTVTKIGNYAFNGCSSLSTATYTGTRAQWINVTKGGGNDSLYSIIQCSDDAQVNLRSNNTDISYIASTGTQYIDTKYYPNQNTRIDMEIESINWNNTFMPFGGRGGNPNNCVALWMYYENASNYLRYGNNDNKIDITLAGNYKNAKFKIYFENGKIKIGEEETTFTKVSDFKCNYSLYIGALNTAQELQNIGRSARIYSFKIYEGETLVRNFIPVYNTIVNQAGLYDTVEGKFYYSLGTNAFVAP
ncbi:MAG: leucine-rich repeat domain-containing protein, partial [Clostridia bacterium]|nr:leucine-rich repeat domain-containing protein [Clostridia bacterium]